VETVARKPRGVEVVCGKARCDPAIRRHRALAVHADERDDDAVAALRRRTGDLDAAILELGRHELTRKVLAALRNRPCLGTERHSPSGDVRRLSTGGRLCGCQRVRSRGKGLAETHDHVEKRIAEGYDQHDL